MGKKSDKAFLAEWEEFKENEYKATPIDLDETEIDKQKRIEDLEKNPEQWFKYYLPNFYTSEPAPFHIRATKRVLRNSEWYEVRSWSRELAKSGRTMMEVLYLVLTGEKKNVLMVSSSYDNAERLLLPYKTILEKNSRIINDYGEQESIGKWESGEFTTRKGVVFRALGAGQSPRGTRKDEVRPDVILIDDIDTDEECRNKDRIKAKVKWIEEALIPTRSISNDLLLIACGNIIAKFCCITEMAKKADIHEIINVRDKDGKSTWPQKNSEERIDRVLSKISHNSAQKEYFNNPITEGDVFKEVYWDKVPPLHTCSEILVYADPSTSNKDKRGGSASHKNVSIIGYKNLKFYVYTCFLDQTSNAKFVDWLFEAYQYLREKKVDTKRIYIENNSLQDPHYQQVLLPIIYQKQNEKGYNLPITPDTRNKPDKYFRIEGNLEPLNRLKKLIFNQAEKNNPHMQRMEDQMLGVSVNAKTMDGPDGIEGGVWIIQNRIVQKQSSYTVGYRSNRKY
ncbi:hypothetical protein [Aquimarina algiphila]|uniref:hypothetical protein n=1 Tax=Aquimarina algiphila TaxID=2047982 RepID=UPI00232E23F8|nr:hypothetical protein [Aquimarina algiphila]